MKTYEALFKFSDVFVTIEAKDIVEAKRKADKLLQEHTPETYCYGIEIEEVKE